MKKLALLLMLAAAFAFAAQQDAGKDASAQQDPAKEAQQPDEKKAEPAPAAVQTAAAEPKQDAPAAADASTPPKEKLLEGVIDVGERWVSPVGGDMNTYRSIVNLDSGPRVVNVDLKLTPSPHDNSPADSILFQAHSWGDPYNSMRLDMQRDRIYRLTSTYSNISYFDYLPSYADPTLTTTGVFMNQRAYDTKTRNFDNELLLLPGYWIQPYIAYSRNTDGGTGISTLVDSSNNQYPVVNNIHWGENTFRGGVRVQLSKLHLTFEQGSIVFKDDQGVYSDGTSLGDRTSPYLGQVLDLTNGWQAYYIRGDGNFTKGFGTFSPAPWVDFYGQIYHSDPSISSTLNQLAQGNIPAATPNLAFYSTAFDQVYGSAAMPRTSGSLSMELRFLNRIRVRESYETDSYHDNSSSTLGELFYLSSGLAASLNTPYTGHLEVAQHRSQTEVLVDVTKKLMLRGGYRYEWGSADVPSGLLSTTTPDESGQLIRHVALAGVKYRPTQRMVFNADMEISDGVKTFYLTGLQDYEKFRVQSRFTLPKNLFFNMNVNYLHNRNPDSGIAATYTSAIESASLQWIPSSHRISLIADYTHSEIRSDTNYITIFPFNAVNESLYVDNASSASMMAEIALPGKGLLQPKLSFGGSMVATAGSRPSRYYQPQGKLLLPLHNHIALYADWQWYALNQPFYYYEGFRAHTVMTGIRFLM
jgi:hypothetical protein